MKRSFLLILCILLSLCGLQAQGWENAYGGTGLDIGYSVVSTQDGGLITCGASTSFGNENETIYVVRTDVDGTLLWENHYGYDTIREYPYSIIEISTGGFLIVGYEADPEGDEEEDLILLKIDGAGNLIWEKSYGGSGKEFGYNAVETTDGGFAIIGETESFGNGDRDIYLLKTDANGTEQWFQTFGGAGRDNGYSILQTDDSGYMLAGYYEDLNNSLREAYLIKTDESGDELWSLPYGEAGFVSGASLIQASGGGFLLAAYADLTTKLIKVDENGEEEWFTELAGLDIAFGQALTYTNDGGIAIAGSAAGSGKLIKTNASGDILWTKNYGGILTDRIFSLDALNNGGVSLSGYTQSYGNGLRDMYLILTDSLGNVFTNFIQGNVFYDLDTQCSFSNNDYGLNDWLLKAEGAQTYYGLTDEEGNYSIGVDTGNYVLSLIPLNKYWNAITCGNDYPVSFSGSYDTISIDFPVRSDYECPLLTVDISTPFLRRCFDSRYYVNYCNDGTIAVEDAEIEVTLDEFLTVNDFSIAPFDQVGNIYYFNVGDLEVGDCDQFYIDVTVDCDSTVLGQTHCAEAHITPDSICLPPDPNWSEASLELDASCMEDSILFTIKNVGPTPMSVESSYIIIVDDVMLSQEPETVPLLSSQQTFPFSQFVDGNTIRVEVMQEPGHPGYNFPSIAVEGCGIVDNSEWSTGYVTQFSENDGNPFVSIDCQENVGSWDPNDKRGFPKGYRAEHYITDSTDLEYHIRFQNTGTDTAFRVVIRDTLAPWLDVHSLKAGASSHDYDLDVYSNGIIKFTFDNILLPDSTTNELASHGFVKFRISQKPNNPIGTVIRNHAAIYFDFNEPVITNETFHTVGADFIEILVGNLTIYIPESAVKVYPNPFLDATTFEILREENTLLYQTKFRLFDTNGRLVREEVFDGNQFQFARNGLPKGIYFYKIESNKDLIFGGKLIAH